MPANGNACFKDNYEIVFLSLIIYIYVQEGSLAVYTMGSVTLSKAIEYSISI